MTDTLGGLADVCPDTRLNRTGIHCELSFSLENPRSLENDPFDRILEISVITFIAHKPAL